MKIIEKDFGFQHFMQNSGDAFIRVYDRTRYLVLFGSEKYDSIYNRIRYLIGVKSGIKYVISYNFARIKVDFIML